MGHRTLMWLGMVICLGAVIAGTMAMASGHVGLWLINCGLFAVNAAMVVFNANRVS